jgi:hypothetical protein
VRLLAQRPRSLSTMQKLLRARVALCKHGLARALTFLVVELQSEVPGGHIDLLPVKCVCRVHQERQSRGQVALLH